MKEFVISEAKAETAVLVGLITQQQDEAKTKEYLDELEFLADTAGAVTVKRFTQKVQGPSQVTYVGKGKLEEIHQYIKQQEDAYYDWLDAGSPEPEEGQEAPQPVGMVIFDDELSAKQMRNIENELKVKILDRTYSIAICCLVCNACGRTWSARVVAQALVAVKVLWACVALVKPSWRWTSASFASVSRC